MNWPTATLSDCLGDAVVYRNLEPADAALPGLRAAWRQIGLPHYAVPRKGTAEHAAYLAFLVETAGQMRGSGMPERLVVVGDTLSGDGAVAEQLARRLPAWAFIGHEQPSLPPRLGEHGRCMVSTRWEGLSAFNVWLGERDFVWDNRAALLLDLDKSLIGARGRNDKVIDAARVAAVRGTVCDSLGDCYDEAAFRGLYDALNQPAYHFITADNQDYLAYICLMAVGGIVPAEELWQALDTRALIDIAQFAALCNTRRSRMTEAIAAAHDEVCRGIEQHDPTPFKGFRHAEFIETIHRMNASPADADSATVLANEIVITAEVFSLARYAASRGALVLGISDKPDEASTPTADQAQAGYQPIHHTRMKVYGKALFG